jgi:hypothetical protein
MKPIASPAVRAVSFLASIAITVLLIFAHAADTSHLGAHEVVVATQGFAIASAASAQRLPSNSR